MRKLLTLLAAAVTAIAASAAVALAAGGTPTAPPTAIVHLSGAVTAAGDSSISLQVAKAGKNAASLVGQTVTIGVDSGTEITIGKDSGRLSDIKVGVRAGVAAKGFPANLVATKLHAGKGDGQHRGDRHFGGAVTAVGSDSLTVKVDRTGKKDTDLMGQTITVSVPSGTPITLGKDKTAISLSDIQVGYRAAVAAKQDSTSGSWTADKIHAGRGNHWFAGEVQAVGSASITVSVKKTGPHDTQLKGQTLSVPVDSSTQYVLGKDKTPITLADIKAGDRVGVVVHAPGGDLSQGMTAVRVHDHRKPAAASTQN